MWLYNVNVTFITYTCMCSLCCVMYMCTDHTMLSSSVHQGQQKQEVLVVQSSTLESSLVKEREAHSKAKEERNGLKVISCCYTYLFVTIQHY